MKLHAFLRDFLNETTRLRFQHRYVQWLKDFYFQPLALIVKRIASVFLERLGKLCSSFQETDITLGWPLQDPKHEILEVLNTETSVWTWKQALGGTYLASSCHLEPTASFISLTLCACPCGVAGCMENVAKYSIQMFFQYNRALGNLLTDD